MRRLNDQAATIGYPLAVIAALGFCTLLTLASLVIPPSIAGDPGWGFLAWRSFLQGAPFNVILSPDAADIARDRANFLSWWSPGQYLVPGVLTLSGISPGSALSLTAGMSLLLCLLGWIRFARYFSLGPIAALLTVIFISTFRYTTLPFRIYLGGEVLLQAATPWIFLLAWRVPALTVYQAAATAVLIVLMSFFVKLTGLVVAGSALAASGLLTLVHSRRITPGIIGGAVGASVAMGFLYLIWFSHGATPASTGTRPFQIYDLVLAFSAPWTAGFSWMDLPAWLFVYQPGALFHDLSAAIWFLPVIAIPVFLLLLLANNYDTHEPGVRLFAICVCAIYTILMLALYIRGAAVGVTDRHFRSAGTLVLVCALALIMRPRMPGAPRFIFLFFCCFMSLYGVGTYTLRVLSIANGEHLDSFSRTSQPTVDLAALKFVRDAYVKEGRDALFVVPSPDVAIAFPHGARIMAAQFESKQEIGAMKYDGIVPGHLYVIMPNSIAAVDKGGRFLAAFSNYDADNWERKRFDLTTVFFQRVTNDP